MLKQQHSITAFCLHSEPKKKKKESGFTPVTNSSRRVAAQNGKGHSGSAQIFPLNACAALFIRRWPDLYAAQKQTVGPTRARPQNTAAGARTRTSSGWRTDGARQMRATQRASQIERENETKRTNETERNENSVAAKWTERGESIVHTRIHTGRDLFHRVGGGWYSARLNTAHTHTREAAKPAQTASRGKGGETPAIDVAVRDRYVAASARSSSPGGRPWGRPQRRRLSPAATRSENLSSSPGVETRRATVVSVYSVYSLTAVMINEGSALQTVKIGMRRRWRRRKRDYIWLDVVINVNRDRYLYKAVFVCCCFIVLNPKTITM